MGWISSAMGAGSSVPGGISKYIAGKAEKQEAEYNEDMARYEASYVKSKSRIDEGIYREDLSRRLGTAQAVAGASGFGQEGTNADLIDQIRKSGEIDAAMIRHGGDVQAWQLESEADQIHTQAEVGETLNKIGMASTFMMMGSQTANAVSQYRNSKPSSSQLFGNQQGSGVTRSAGGGSIDLGPGNHRGIYYGRSTNKYSGASSSWWGR